MAGKLANHSEIKKRTEEELQFLKFQIEHPWRFSFCSIQQNVHKDFYEMKDVLSEESFLLYSPGLTLTVEDLGFSPELWFLLTDFNGECRQTYGTLKYFRGFQRFDLFFFAKQLNADIIFGNQVQDVIESDPLPFLLSWVAGNIPPTYHNKDMVVFNRSDFKVIDFNPENYAQDFLIENKPPITMMSLKRWHKFPHFARCFFNSKENLLTFSSVTVRGYKSLLKAMGKYEGCFPENPDFMVTPPMIAAIEKVLNVDIEMIPYEEHFDEELSEADSIELKKFDRFLNDLAEKLNRREEYNIAEMATKAQIDIEDANRIAEI